MIQALLEGDQWLFKVINSSMSNSLFDLLLPWFRERLFWAPFYLFIVAFTPPLGQGLPSLGGDRLGEPVRLLKLCPSINPKDGVNRLQKF